MPVRKASPSDPQQWRLYRMESEAIGARGYARLTRKTLVSFVRGISRQYKVWVPEIEFVQLNGWSAEYDNGILRFNTSRRHALDVITAAHEFAHHLHSVLVPLDTHQAHGPQFLACYLSVLDTARIIPTYAMRPICDKYKITYADPGDRNDIKDLWRAVQAPA